MNANVVTIDAGIARLAMIVVRQSWMKSRIVNATRMAATTRWKFSSSIDSTMNFDWSLTTNVSMSGGSSSWSRSNRCLDLLDHVHRVRCRTASG